LSKKKSPSGIRWWRVPPAVRDVQVNHCKNPLCGNFGIAPSPDGGPRRKKGTPAGPGDYVIVAAGAGRPQLRCELCSEHVPLQSNLAIVEELMRLGAYLDPPESFCCTNEACESFGVTQAAGERRYVRFGKTKSGIPRHKCLTCGKVSSAGAMKATHRQRITHKNRDVFLLLVNKSPLRRIAAVTGLSMPTLFRKLEFIHRQCLRFAGERERQLTERQLGTRYICVDRQTHIVNWSSRKDRRNVALLAIGSADLESGYVFGMHLNFDGAMDSAQVEADLERFGDHHLSQPFRRYARVWLERDYDQAAARNGSRSAKAGAPEATEKVATDQLTADIEATYESALVREDIEASDTPSPHRTVPARGMQVHEQVSMNAHIQFVCRLLRGARKLRFFMDQESGLRAAVMAAAASRVRARTADAFYVKVMKETTIDAKRRAVKAAQGRLAEARDRNSGLDDGEVRLLLIKEEMERMAELGKWKDRWLAHPLPSMSEPDRRICWLTDLGDYDEMHAARLYLKATLHPIDRYFMQVRRRLSLAERPIGSASAARRTWYGYSAYQPANLARVLDIFRVFYNYCQPGEDGKTPATRLGLARGPVAPEDILYFVPTAQQRVTENENGQGVQSPCPSGSPTSVSSASTP
jgi:transposase-like protein